MVLIDQECLLLKHRQRKKVCKVNEKSSMTNDAAISILECMAIDLAGGLTGLNRMNPMYDVLEQRLGAINMAQEALRKETTP